MFSSSRYLLTDLEAKFSIMSKTGLKPLFVKYVMFSLKVAIVGVPFKSFTGVASIALDYQSYITKIAVFPSFDMIGDFPVKSTHMVPFFGLSIIWYANR